uniref:Uncharacterized protein n=1 Tax=Myoviridae sp. ctIty1 TaxID=2827673 RepID=A0A8S5TGQ0_9CAUD|nr:MAG TPA: hypothetical protein [Myoviridae sp. ctIty1]
MINGLFEVNIDSTNLYAALEESKNLKSEITIIPAWLLQSSPDTSICGVSFNSVATIGYFEKIKDKVHILPRDLGLHNIAFLSKDLNPFFKSIKDNNLETNNFILGLKPYDINCQPFMACHYIRTQTKHMVHNERQPHTNKVITTEQDIFAQMNTIPSAEVLKYINYYSFYAYDNQCRVVLKDYDLDSDEEFQNIMTNKASDGIFPFTFKDQDGNRNYEYLSYVNKSMLNIAKGDITTMEIKDNLINSSANRFLVKYDIYKKSKKCKLTVIFMALKF